MASSAVNPRAYADKKSDARVSDDAVGVCFEVCRSSHNQCWILEEEQAQIYLQLNPFSAQIHPDLQSQFFYEWTINLDPISLQRCHTMRWNTNFPPLR